MTGFGRSPRCKPCTSKHRAEIDAKLLAGEATRAVSEWLDAEHGETISHAALANHKLAHLAVVEAAKAKLAAAPPPSPAFTAAVEKVVADVTLLDEVAGIAMRTVRAFDGNPPADMPGAVVFTGVLREVRQIVVARHEILHGKKVNLDATGLAEFLALGFEGKPADEGEEPPGSVGK